jgi:phosphoglycerol transferase MdoB-like AlkP superfamily enzyme
MSMAGYIAAVPLLAFIVCWLFRIRISVKIPRWYNRILIILFSFITIVNFNIYREWGTKINYRALDFAFNTPKEAIASSSSSPVFSSFLIFFILIAASFFLEKRITDYKLPNKASWVQKIAVSILVIIVTFTVIRGGWQLSPINESMAYYSENPFLNHSAVNTEWTLIHDLISNKYSRKNPYTYYKPEKAKKIVEELYTEHAYLTPSITNNPRPNVVLIILESYTADLIESLGGEKGVAPNFEKLIKNGLLFTNVYAAGDRTDKGLIAILSAFPSQAIRSVIKLNNKHEKLPSLAQEFKKNGYRTSFYYGGESEFFNMKSYLLSHSFDHLIDKHEFKQKDMNSKWGAYDGVVFDKQLEDLASSPQPFFSTLLTLTNHEPFELPVESHFKGDSNSDKFRSTAYYTDSSLTCFLSKAKKQPWYKNTLFVIVADHGHPLPKATYENYNPYRFRIPLLFYGDVLKPEYRGVKIEKFGDQTDIASTLFNQLNMESKQFTWSKDLLNPGTKEFAFFNWENGFGFATPEQTISFDNVSKKLIYKTNATAPDSVNNKGIQHGKAIMQEVFQEYLNF